MRAHTSCCQYYAKLGCTNQGGLKIYAYTDENCSQATNTNIGLYNDIKVSCFPFFSQMFLVLVPAPSTCPHAYFFKYFPPYTQISFSSCQSCVSWPKTNNDDAADDIEVDDNFDNYHGYDSKLCGAASQFKETCGYGCQRAVKKSLSASSNNSKSSWGGFEKFCLCFWSFASECV